MRTLYSYKLKSHPDLLLVEHLKKVSEIGLKIFYENKLFSKDEEFIKSLLVGHDLGKATKYFQEYIQNIKSHGHVKNHGFLSALITYSILIEETNIDSALKGFFIVRKHHGDLFNIGEELALKPREADGYLEVLEKQLNSMDFDEVNAILRSFELPVVSREKIIDHFIILFKDMEAVFAIDEELSLNKEEYIKMKYFYSILIYSDKSSLILENIQNDGKISKREKFDNYFQRLPKPKNIINDMRDEAKKEVESHLGTLTDKTLTLTLPTGLGKTLTSLNFAIKLKEKLYKEQGIHYNLIYSFPFTSIIDQTYDIFKNIFGDSSKNVLKHHYLSKVRYKDEEDYFEIDKGKFLIETWDSNLVVTTFVKLIQTIFSNKNNELLKFHKLANSIIILDEVQNIPYKYWKLINDIFKALSKVFNTYFIMMTATQPMIIKNSNELIEDKEKYFTLFNRTKLIIDLNEKNIEEFIQEIEETVIKCDKAMIVLNTVKSAQEVYKYLKDKVDREVIFLSASIIPKDRKNRIDKIKELEQYVLVSTQVVEAGVDIDNDVVIRDIGPWDSIVQCAGRCNRNNKRDVSNVYIYKLKGERNVYANIVYGRFLISRTERILEGKEEIHEIEYYKYSQMYFQEIDKEKSNDYSNEVIKDMETFKFFDVDQKVQLIENNTLNIIPIFIEKDQEAIEIWRKYEKISHIKDKFLRKNKFLEMKDEFLTYVININAKKYPFEKDKFYNKIPFENVEDYYSEEYGFCVDDDKTLFF